MPLKRLFEYYFRSFRELFIKYFGGRWFRYLFNNILQNLSNILSNKSLNLIPNFRALLIFLGITEIYCLKNY